MEPTKIDGRSKAARAMKRTQPEQPAGMDIDVESEMGAPPVRRATRQQTREPVREAPGDKVFYGRNGEQLTRVRSNGSDPYDVPQHLIPKGWTYQWNTVTVYNDTNITRRMTNQMYNNGWRPVPAERHDGIFMPIGAKGEILLDGLRLEERPKHMSDEARAEDVAVAKHQE